MIARMERVEIVFLRSEFDAMVKFLQDRGVMHIEEVPLALEEQPGFLHRVHLPEEQRIELAGLQDANFLLKEALPLLNHAVSHAELAAAGPVLEAEGAATRARHVRLWHRQLRSLHRRLFNAEDSAAALRRYQSLLATITPLLSVRGVTLGETARAVVLQGFSEDGIRALQKKIVQHVSGSVEFLRQDIKDGIALVIVHPAGKGGDVVEVLRAEGLPVLSSPDSQVTGKSMREVALSLENKLAQLEADKAQLKQDLTDLSKRIAAPMHALAQILQSRISQLEVNNNFAQSKFVGVVQGWVPATALDDLCRELKTAFGARVALGTLSKADVDHRRIPTLLQNKGFFKPFEVLMSVMKPATYGTYDPTALVGMAFVFFYGFIVGDAGYGLSIIALSYWARSKWGHIPVVVDATTVFKWMGISTTAFGILYAEFFGEIPAALGIHAIFHRAHATTQLLALAVLVGLIHIVTSLVIAIREGFAHGHRKHAEEKLAMLLGLTALLVAAGGISLGVPFAGYLGAIIFAVALFYFVRSMGAMAPMGVIEIIGLSSNILSYGRLMALGIAGIAFAEIANGLPASLGILGVVLAFFVHVFNFGLSVFSPTIHSLRLNLVEFLPKFYEADGRPYQPFRKDMAW
jgi:V/A-type H+-transporting ATPase subunit I